MRRWLRCVAAVAAVGAVSACVVATDFDAFTAGTKSVPHDSAVVEDASVGDASAEQIAPPDGSAAPPGGVVVAHGASTFAAGNSQQHHVHFAQNLGAWAIFYYSAAQQDQLFVRFTTDFVSFVDAAPLSLPQPHNGDGRNFDVAYANIAGKDVFHVVYATHVSGSDYAYHARAVVHGNTLTWDTPIELGEDRTTDPIQPDAPAVAILPTGKVLFSSGIGNVNGHHANFDTYDSVAVDDGSDSYADAVDAGVEVEVVQDFVNARTIVPIASGAVAFWERGDKEPDPTDMGFAVWDGAWTDEGTAGFSLTSYDPNDWNVIPTSGARVDAVRYATGMYAHRYFDANGGHDGFAVPAATQAAGDGVVLLNLDGVTTLIGIDATSHTFRKAVLSSSAWSPWTTFGAADATRRRLSGNTAGPHGVLLWEQDTSDGSIDLAAMPLP